jgi:hypothetical protein
MKTSPLKQLGEALLCGAIRVWGSNTRNDLTNTNSAMFLEILISRHIDFGKCSQTREQRIEVPSSNETTTLGLMTVLGN